VNDGHEVVRRRHETQTAVMTLENRRYGAEILHPKPVNRAHETVILRHETLSVVHKLVFVSHELGVTAEEFEMGAEEL